MLARRQPDKAALTDVVPDTATATRADAFSAATASSSTRAHNAPEDITMQPTNSVRNRCMIRDKPDGNGLPPLPAVAWSMKSAPSREVGFTNTGGLLWQQGAAALSGSGPQAPVHSHGLTGSQLRQNHAPRLTPNGGAGAPCPWTTACCSTSRPSSIWTRPSSLSRVPTLSRLYSRTVLPISAPLAHRM